VLAAARRVGYSGPDPVARGLRSGRAGAIGVVYDTRLTYALRDPAAGAFPSGIGECAEGDRLGLLLVPGTAPGYRDGAAGAAALLESSPRPTALIATSDELALGARHDGSRAVSYSTASASAACAISVSIGMTSAARACVAPRTTAGAQPAS
jgi:DNA-binding LacI/PurR family transcriptional regulator